MTQLKAFPREQFWLRLAGGTDRTPIGAFWQGILDGFSAPTRLCQHAESRYTHFDSVGYAWLSVGDAMTHALEEYEREVIPGEQEKQKTYSRTRYRFVRKADAGLPRL